MKLPALLLAMTVSVLASAAWAATMSVDLRPDAKNPASPQMGDTLAFHSVIHNAGNAPIEGLIAWLSLVQVDKGKEQPVDLEDWSAHKAVTASSIPPGGRLESTWPMRLIQAGKYRVVVSAVSRDGAGLVASPFADFAVLQKPVVESRRVLPVAFGVPLLLGIVMLWRWKIGRGTA